jgi:hypothetical protein
MHIERSEWTGNRAFSQVTIASFAMRKAVGPTGNIDPPLDLQGRFPSGAVAFRMILRGGFSPGLSVALEHPESSFPIHLDAFVAPEYVDKDVPASIWRSIDASGQYYHAIAWIAPDAPESLRATLAQVLGSLSFAPLRPGTVVGAGSTVLEPEDRYPLGSFTPSRASGLPLCVVHAPGGFYALGWNWPGGPPGGYRSSCDPRVDQQRTQLYCADCDARWDRVGQVITKPPTAKHDDPLHLSIAKVAWDGHVMVQPNTYQISSPPTRRRFWPDWRTDD